MTLIRNRFMKAACLYNHKIVSIEESKAGDVCLYDNVQNRIIIVSGTFSSSDYPADIYTPIGVVVVPGSHQIYGANTCGIISIVDMSCNTPASGTLDNATMCFSPQTDLTLTNYNVVIVYDGNSLKTNGFGYLSKDGKYNSTTLCIPEPYNSDMDVNLDYFNTSISKLNAMSDIKGKQNTNTLVNIRGTKDYSSWKPTYNKSDDYPAASCCNMFYTVGTSQGDWYLPAAGEWGYVMCRWTPINKGLKLLKNVYNSAMLLTDNTSYWTSSEHNAKNTRYVHTDNGMGHIAKTTATLSVRAFKILTGN